MKESELAGSDKYITPGQCVQFFSQHTVRPPARFLSTNAFCLAEYSQEAPATRPRKNYFKFSTGGV